MEVYSEEYLEHFGVMGMKWGHRKEKLPGVPHKTFKEARKDAEEFTRAKMFYGEGAGTRRKLIKATTQAKSKRDPAYAKALDHHISNTDFAQRADQAKSQRHRKDTVATTAKTARGVKRQLMGQFAPTFTALAVTGGILYATSPVVRATVNRVGLTSFSKVKSSGLKAFDFARRNAGAAKLFAKGFRGL